MNKKLNKKAPVNLNNEDVLRRFSASLGEREPATEPLITLYVSRSRGLTVRNEASTAAFTRVPRGQGYTAETW